MLGQSGSMGWRGNGKGTFGGFVRLLLRNPANLRSRCAKNEQSIGCVALCGGSCVDGGAECSGGAANACWRRRWADGQVDGEGGLLWDGALRSVGAQGRGREAYWEVLGGQAGRDRGGKRGAFCGERQIGRAHV